MYTSQRALIYMKNSNGRASGGLGHRSDQTCNRALSPAHAGHGSGRSRKNHCASRHVRTCGRTADQRKSGAFAADA
jgi:hypothetical protein